MSDEQLFKVKNYCDKKKIGFLCTAFEHKSVEFLSEKLRVQSIKVPSPEITNIPLLKHISKKFSQLIISTGASDLSECTRALDIFRARNRHTPLSFRISSASKRVELKSDKYFGQ